MRYNLIARRPHQTLAPSAIKSTATSMPSHDAPSPIQYPTQQHVIIQNVTARPDSIFFLCFSAANYDNRFFFFDIDDKK